MASTGTVRTQQLSLQVAKHVFLHPDKRVVFSHDPIRLADARRAGLEPLLIYGLTYQGLPARYWELHPLEAPAPLEAFLFRAWHDADWMKGPPDQLEVSADLYRALADTLVARIEQCAVPWVVNPTTSKSYVANRRFLQAEAGWCSFPLTIKHKDGREAMPLEILNQGAFMRESRRHRTPGYEHSRQTEGLRAYLDLPVKPVPSSLTETPARLDWTAGPWLQVSENKIPRIARFEFFQELEFPAKPLPSVPDQGSAFAVIRGSQAS